MRRENNECHEDEDIRDKRTGELSKSTVISCSSHNGRIKNEHKEKKDRLELCIGPECVPALDDS